jgi:hypothetical protein
MSWFEQRIFWHDTRCMDGIVDFFGKVPPRTKWESGWIVKVYEVWCGLEWYLICGKSSLNQLRTGSRV